MPAVACREKEHEALSKFLHERWEGLHSNALFVFGSPGTGKTMSVSNLAASDVLQRSSSLDGDDKAKKGTSSRKTKSATATVPPTAVRFGRVNCAAMSTLHLHQAVTAEIDKFSAAASKTTGGVLRDRTNKANSNSDNLRRSMEDGATVGIKKKVDMQRVTTLREKISAICHSKIPPPQSRKLLVLTLDEVDFTEQSGAAQGIVNTILEATSLHNTSNPACGYIRYCGLALIFISNCREKIINDSRIQELAFAPYTTEQNKEIGPVLRSRALAGKSVIFSSAGNEFLAKKNEGDARDLRDFGIAAMRKAEERTKKSSTNDKSSASKRGKRNRDGDENEEAVEVTVGPADVVAVEKCSNDLQMLSPETLVVLCVCVRLVREKLRLHRAGELGQHGGGGSGTSAKVSVNLAIGGNPRLLSFSELWSEYVQLQKSLSIAVRPNQAEILRQVSALSDSGFATAMSKQGFELLGDERELKLALESLQDQNISYKTALRVLTEGSQQQPLK